MGWMQAPFEEAQKWKGHWQGQMKEDMKKKVLGGAATQSDQTASSSGIIGTLQKALVEFNWAPEYSVYASLILVLVFVLLLAVQESVEWRAFSSPQSWRAFVLQVDNVVAVVVLSVEFLQFHSWGISSPRVQHSSAVFSLCGRLHGI